MPNPSPTTAKYLPAETPVVPPHGESHDIDGSDPILNEVRLLSLKINSGSQTINNAFGVYEAVTGLSDTVNTRGGTLRITFGGFREINGTSATEYVSAANSFILWFENLNTGVTFSSEPQGDQVSYADNTAGATVHNIILINAASIIWFISGLDAGRYSIELRGSSNGTGNLYLGTLATNYLQIEELKPVRRS